MILGSGHSYFFHLYIPLLSPPSGEDVYIMTLGKCYPDKDITETTSRAGRAGVYFSAYPAEIPGMRVLVLES